MPLAASRPVPSSYTKRRACQMNAPSSPLAKGRNERVRRDAAPRPVLSALVTTGPGGPGGTRAGGAHRPPGVLGATPDDVRRVFGCHWSRRAGIGQCRVPSLPSLPRRGRGRFFPPRVRMARTCTAPDSLIPYGTAGGRSWRPIATATGNRDCNRDSDGKSRLRSLSSAFCICKKTSATRCAKDRRRTAWNPKRPRAPGSARMIRADPNPGEVVLAG